MPLAALPASNHPSQCSPKQTANRIDEGSKRSSVLQVVCCAVMLVMLLFHGNGSLMAEESLESQLTEKPLSELAKRARILGNTTKGAIAFHRLGLSCVQCHATGTSDSTESTNQSLLGPDLALLSERATYKHVIESLLTPSKQIRAGYQAETILLSTGKALNGMVRSESEDELEVFVPGEESTRTILLDDIEEREISDSMMPTGLVNQLSDEAEFFDLVSFVVAIGKAGPGKVADLLPAKELLEPKPLPEYESKLDHRGLISDWGEDSLRAGKELYNQLCINCHGTWDRPGSLPNALRFASDKFRNGADPWSMYKTVTHGYRMMLPQRQLTPQQKYNVIHYIREAYLKKHNPSQYVAIEDDYLASLPEGTKRGPAPVEHHPWRDMDYGPFLINTYEMAGPDTLPRPRVGEEEHEIARRDNRPAEERWPDNTNFAYKGIAVRLDQGPGGVSAGSHWLAFDHDTLRVAGAWTGKGFIDWQGILLNGRHVISPRTIGKQHFATPPGPGWAHPETGSFEDPRFRARDGRQYGPLPRDWAQYNGLYKHGNRVVISYTVGETPILESYRIDARQNVATHDDADVWVRILNVGKSAQDLVLRVSPAESTNVTVNGSQELRLVTQAGFTTLRIPAAATPTNFELRLTEGDAPEADETLSAPPEDLRPLTRGGPASWPQKLPTIPEVGDEAGPLVADTLTRPIDNPWRSRLRLSGLDFLPDGRLIVCCCDGDVWIVEGTDQLGESIQWSRIASGLFQPLGIKVIDGRIFVGCRDQIVLLHDLNDDGEIDFYENFNNDHQVTDHFHEFAMGLQSDAAGNLYYAKSARHARDSLVPQHGTLLKVSADGDQTTILANGFRAANGVCINDDGSFFVTDQEGHWTPMNRINRVIEGGFYGNMYGYGAPKDSRDQAMEQPLCWPDKNFDRSPAELVWVDSSKWGPLNGSLLNLSYGVGEAFLVPHEQVNGQWQGGLCRLPLEAFPTGIMRARFHPNNGILYGCGMQAWGTNQTDESGGLYRVRYTGQPLHLPKVLNAHTNGLTITFTEPLDPQTANAPENYMIETWTLRRSKNYGSGRHGKKQLRVSSASLDSDGRTVRLLIPEIEPVQCMQIAYQLKDAEGDTFQGVVQNTIHSLK